MKRIVSAVEDGVPQAEAARLFGVARWSVARYVRLTREGKPLSSKQSGSVKPTKVREEAKRALRTDLEVRPFATLQQRREMLYGSLGVNMCLSTVYEQRNPQRRVKPKTTAWVRNAAAA